MTARLESEKLREQIYPLYLRGASWNDSPNAKNSKKRASNCSDRLKNDRWFRKHSDMEAVLLGQAHECLDKLRRLYSSVTRSIEGYDFYPSEDEKILEGQSRAASLVSQILPNLNDLSSDHDLAERGKLAGQDSKSSDPESDMPEQPQNDEIQE